MCFSVIQQLFSVNGAQQSVLVDTSNDRTIDDNDCIPAWEGRPSVIYREMGLCNVDVGAGVPLWNEE
jgi:hypothetical protein